MSSKKIEKEHLHTIGNVTETNTSKMKTNEDIQAVIYSQPTTSIIVIICLAILLISLKIAVILGWILLILMMFLFTFGRNKKQFTFYQTFMIIHALDDDSLSWKIDYSSMKFWELKHSYFSLSTLTIETMGKNGQRIETRCWNYNVLKKALMKSIPSKIKVK